MTDRVGLAVPVDRAAQARLKGSDKPRGKGSPEPCPEAMLSA